jgi:outer membrane protein assembly factor BamD (BamD/ComL family)
MPYRIKVNSRGEPVDEAQLLRGMERLLFQVQENRRPILIGALVLLLVVGAVVAMIFYDRRQAEQAQELTLQATKLYVDRPGEKPAKADENLKQAISLYRQVIEQYPRTPAAQLALYHLGNALVQINDLDGAIEAYRKYVTSYGANKMLLGLVYQRLGYAYLLKGDHEQAAKAFAAVLEVPGALNKDQVLFELGKLEEVQSRPEGALARYQDLAKSYPNSPFASEAAVRIKALEVKSSPESGPAERTPPPVTPAK